LNDPDRIGSVSAPTSHAARRQLLSYTGSDGRFATEIDIARDESQAAPTRKDAVGENEFSVEESQLLRIRERNANISLFAPT
jgi:hypothetical protein